MKVSLKQINGPWDQGWVLDKHMVSSTFLGNDDRGHPCFDNQRTEIGEATYQLKYQKDWNQVGPLAQAVATNVFPRLDQVGFVVPMPASNIRQRQPVTEVAWRWDESSGGRFFRICSERRRRESRSRICIPKQRKLLRLETVLASMMKSLLTGAGMFW